MKTVQKNRCFSGERKKTMAKAVKAERATLPMVTSVAMIRLFKRALPRLARVQAVCALAKNSPCGMKLNGTLLTCWTDWLAPEMTTRKGPMSRRKPATMIA